MKDFENQVVLITGAGRGVGRALAEAFAAQGACVAANDITPINLDETLARVVAAGGTIRDYVADIAKKMPVQALLNQVMDDWGRLDILINNAHVDPRKPLLDLDEWDWRRAVDVNLTGPFLLMQSAGRMMKAAGGGVMVNVLSGQGGPVLRTGMSALAALTRDVSQEFSAYNIRVNAVQLPSEWASGQQGLPADELAEAVFALCRAEGPSGEIVIPR